MRRSAVSVALSLALSPTVVMGQVPVGPVFQANVFTTDSRSEARLASDATGNFVITWSSRGQDGDSRGVFARRYDFTGTPLEVAEFQLNAYTTGSQRRPAVAWVTQGPILFAWDSEDQDGSDLGIQGRFNDSGEFQVNTYIPGSQSAPSVAGSPGGLVVIWNSAGQDGSGSGLFGQRGSGGEFAVNSYTTGEQGNFMSAVAMADDGRFVVVWDGEGAGDVGGVFAQRFDAAGLPAGSEFRVNVHTYQTQSRPSVASDPDGNFVVVWTDDNPPGANTTQSIMARRYDASGTALTDEFIVSDGTTCCPDFARVAMDRGHFVVAWERPGPVANSDDVFARAFDHAGPAGEPFRVGPATGAQQDSAVALTGIDGFVVAWGDSASGSYDKILAQRFRWDVIFRDGFGG
jgi:hypothetical protein